MKSSSLRLFVAVIAILAFTVACSLPFVISPVQPTEKIVYVEITSTPEAASTPEPTATVSSAAPAATPTVSVNLDGPWTIWEGVGQKQLDIDFLQQGYSLVANTATDDGESLLFNGTISQDGKSVSGTWESTDGTSGSFLMALDPSLSSFSGNLGGGVAFCGNRGGFSKPSPCIK